MDKLQELTQKLYNEGLSKGKEEGEALLAKAREESAGIVKKAQEEAEAILEKARKDAEDYKIKMEGDVKMAATQTLQATRESLEKLIVAEAVDKPVKEALSSEEFVKGILTAVAQRFTAEESQEMALVLPENLKAGLEPYVKNELSKAIGKGVEATFSKRFSGGFKIGPKDGSYFISFTEESFRELVGEYLRPATKKILFG